MFYFDCAAASNDNYNENDLDTSAASTPHFHTFIFLSQQSSPKALPSRSPDARPLAVSQNEMRQAEGLSLRLKFESIYFSALSPSVGQMRRIYYRVREKSFS